MPKIQYESKKLSPATLDLVEKANLILTEYERQGYTLTLRQLYYQFVSRALIPNRQAEYKKLGDAVSKGRRGGLIDWDAIIDRTRNLVTQPAWSTPHEIVGACAQQFRVDKRADQPYHVEIWVEKDALVGVFERPARRHQVGLFACRGFTSDSEIWAAAQRLKGVAARRRAWNGYKGVTPVILHFGDHDPSGIDMTRDIRKRLELFAGMPIKVERLALNMPQIEEYNPPPNPAKSTDSRFEGYVAMYGDESWELDALEPSVLDQIVSDKIEEYTDADLWDSRVKVEREYRAGLACASDKWAELMEHAEREWGFDDYREFDDDDDDE